MALPYQLHQRKRQLENQRQNNQHQQQENSQYNFDILKGLPLWLWDKAEHRKLAIETNQQCCMTHVIGCPLKNNRPMPLFDYEKLIFDAIENNQNIWILNQGVLALPLS